MWEGKKFLLYVLYMPLAAIVAGGFIGFTKKTGLIAINLITRSQFVFLEKGQMYDRKDTVLLCFTEGLVIYRESYFYIQANKKSMRGDTIIVSDDPDAADFREKRFHYYVWRRNGSKAIFYSGDNDNTEVQSVDSISVQRLFKNAEFYNVRYDSLINRQDMGKHAFLETYINRFKPDPSYCDSTFYKFSTAYNNIPFSLSPAADREKNAKLIEVRFVFNPVPKGISETIDIPKREMNFKITKTDFEMDKSFLEIINKFKNDSKLLKIH